MIAHALKVSSRNLLVFILVSYAVVISLFLDAGLRNYQVLLAAMLGAAAIFVFSVRSITRELLLTIFLLTFMAISVSASGVLDEIGSVALTGVFALGYLASGCLLDCIADKRAFIANLLRKIIYAFAIVSVVQMVTSVFALPAPNLIGSKGLWSYNSLSAEPSHLGRVVGISMLAYLIVTRPGARPEPIRSLFLKHRGVLLAFLVTMLLSGSALAALAIPAALMMSRSLRLASFVLVFIFVAWPLILFIEFEPLRRAVLLMSSVGSLDINTLFNADASGASRLIPALIYLREVSPGEPGFWFGYGSNGLTRLFLGRIPGFGEIVSAGFFPGFAVVYGVTGLAMFLWIFVLRFFNRATFPVIAFWIVFFSTTAWNTQVLWYGLIVIWVVYLTRRDVHKLN